MKNENKKIKKARDNQKRVRALFNTGERPHKNKKKYDRKRLTKIYKYDNI